MKPLFLALAVAFIIGIAGCADPLEERSSDEVGAQLQRGVTGKGTLGPIDRPENDPAAQHSIPQDQ